MLHDSSPPEFMTCGELVHQDDKYIREYASLYGIPEDVNRSEMLERIILLNPGSEACIPILKHFIAQRGVDGRVRFIGRVSPTPEPPNRAPRVVPASRRLTRHSVKKHVLNDLSQRTNIALQPVPSPSGPSTSPSSLDRPLSPPSSPKAAAPPKDISIIPDEVNPARRFPTPFDTYSPGPSSPGSGSGSPHSSRQGSPSVKPMMEFVYPPRPRPSGKGRDNTDASDRQHSPGPDWLQKMLIDVQRGRTTLKSELAELTREANDAAAEIMKVQILRDREAKEMDKFLINLRKIVGPEVVQGIIDRATQAAEERTSDEDDDDDDDEDDGGSDDDESENNDSGIDNQKTNSDSSSSHNDSDDQGGDRDDGQTERENHADEDTVGSGNDSRQNIDILELETVPLAYPEDLVGVEGQPSGNSSDDKRNEPAEASQQPRVVSDNPPTRRDSGNKSRTRQNRNVGDKRGADSDSDSGPSSHKRPKLTNTRGVVPVGTSKSQPSPSRKRLRDSDDSDSAWEVEESVRLTGDESSSGGPHKKPRSDVGASGSLSSPCPSGNGRNDSDFSQESGDNLEYEAGRDEPYRSDNENDEEADKLADIDPGPSDNGSLSPPQSSHKLPRFRSRLPPLASMPWPESSATNSQPTAGPSSRPRNESPPMSRPDSPRSSVEDTQPSAGPSNPRQRPRGLTRARERLRPTASGDVEAYAYDEGSDYEHRLEREAQTLAAWRRYDAPKSTYPFQSEFEVIRGAPNVPPVTFADEEDEETEIETKSLKGKGKEKA